MKQTIFALSSAPGRAGVAVIRLSGPDAGAALKTLTGKELPPPREARLRALRDSHGQLIDQALVLWLPGPHSFTGEDIVELHGHGGRAVVAALLQRLGDLPDLRPAEPGEFSRRAFEAGRLDLTAIEGLADLIHADTEAQRRQALRQMDGSLGRLYQAWAETCKRALAYLEADLDFPDEDLPDSVVPQVRPKLAELQTAISAHLNDQRRGERLRDGIVIAILGAPNVGKSSLLNWLAQRDVAIVSPTAGTTRDVLEVQLDLGGYPATLLDTAGLRETSDAIEGEGIRRARARADAADLKLIVFAADEVPSPDLLALIDPDSLVVINKIDRQNSPLPTVLANLTALPLSLKRGDGLDQLLDNLATQVATRLGGEGLALTRQRHRDGLMTTQAHLARALTLADPVLVAEEVRMAMRSLGRITGRVDVEDLLDVIFRDFCIGK